MKQKINNKYILIYLIILLFLSYFFLYFKHQVGNDSTISEWLINYEGGFTRRGVTGQIVILFTRLFDTELRWTIFLFQSFSCTIYFLLLWHLFKNLKTNRIITLAIFTPIFILYPIAEIEVLARKEILVFILLLIYLLIPSQNLLKNFFLAVFSFLSILVWEPTIFFIPIVFLYLIIENKIEKFDLKLIKIISLITPGIFLSFYIIFNPLSDNQWDVMASVLKNEFGETCYMSCKLLKSKSSIIQQFQGNLGKYSLEVFLRYFLIIMIGFYPLLVLIKNSSVNNKKLIFFRNFDNLLLPFCIATSPVILLFAMGYDWGRWVNISYVILVIIILNLIKSQKIILNLKSLEKNLIYKIKGKFFIIFFIIFCFGWNPKTVITGDIASFPGYRVPVKVFNKIIFGEY